MGGPNTWELLNTVDTNWTSSEDETAAVVNREQEQPPSINDRNINKPISNRKKKSNSRTKKVTSVKKQAKTENVSESVLVSSGSEEDEVTVLTKVDIGAIASRDKQMVELVQLEDHDPSIQVDESLSEEVRTRGGIKNGKGGGRKKSKKGSQRSSPSEGTALDTNHVPAKTASEPRTNKRKKQKK